MSTPELHDVQGLVARGYGNLSAARFVLLELGEPAAARAAIGAVAATLTGGDERPEERAVNVAFTSSGLLRLGLPRDVLHLFSNEFADGMTTPHSRRVLGDVDENAPERWEWGGPSRPVDAVLMLYAQGRHALDTFEQEHLRLISGGASVVARLGTSDLQGYEPFGFRDGVSQPFVEGLSKQGPAKLTVRFGEFVLGYPNEHGRFTEPALLDQRPELGRNGSYLVFRQLRQDVGGFWQFLDGATRREDGSSDPERRLRLAAKMVGRWPEGSPLALAPERNDPALEQANDFGYHVDPRGVRCPVGAHIRRANPRDSLDPRPGSDASLGINRRHRILRRGREYGPPLTIEEALRGEDAGVEERGIHFICLNGNIARQFEFVHDTWLNNPKFAGFYDDSDPLVSPSHPYGGTFTIPSEGVRERVTGVPRFVSVKGGAYFFLPGVSATRHLATLE